jgi:hypothetical protein
MKIIRPMTITDAVLASSNVPETDYAAWSAATTYADDAYAIIVSADTHQVWQSIAAGNLNHPPATSPTWWALVGATNRWRMFDQSTTSQTSNADSIAVSLDTAGRIDAVALMNVDAAEASITMTDAVAGVVYDRTVSLVSTSGINDAWSYCFEPIVRRRDLVLDDLPPYANAQIDITLSAPGSTVKCGNCIVGLSRSIGDTQRGARLGIQDYSLKTRDAWGNYTVTERAYNRTASFLVQMDAALVDEVTALLATYRATPIVYLGTTRYASTAVFGFYKDFTVEIAYATRSVCSLDVEGLT